MNDKATALAARLIRNFEGAALEPFERAPHYASRGTRLAIYVAAPHARG